MQLYQLFSTFAIALALCTCTLCNAEEQTQNQHHQKQGSKSKCTTKCALCQSVNQMNVLQLCSANQLTPCGCPQFEIENVTSSNIDSLSARSDCDKATSTVGFCPYGQIKDPRTKCPTELCSAPASCPQDWQQRCPASLWCPAGHAIDENGCPLCRCACNDRLHTVAGCSAACTQRGLEFEVAPPLTEGDCYSCICKESTKDSSRHRQIRQQSKPGNRNNGECVRSCNTSCGPYGFANATADADGCIANCSCKCPEGRDSSTCPMDCAVSWSRDAYGCERCSCKECPPEPNCPTDCGPHGFKVQFGCRTDCACACPPAKCPKGCQRFTWARDVYGCTTCKCAGQQQEQKQQQQCTTLSCPSCGPHGYKQDARGCNTCSCKCPSVDSHCPSSSCLKWTRDEFGCTTCSICKAAKPCVKDLTADMGDLCPSECTNYLLQKDSEGCLTCNCEDRCPPEPKCFIGCGGYKRKRDANGCITTCDCECPKVEMQTCQQSCKYNASLVKDVYGCPMCRCESPKCDYEFHCSNSCGDYGYEGDGRGCRKSCNCNCPARKCNCAAGNCNCLFGFESDQFGCKTCKCKEYNFQFFNNFA